MKFQRICLASIKLILSISLLFPCAAFAHLISIKATTPFPSVVHVLSTATATFTITNITSRVTLTAVDQSHFPAGSGLTILSSTCGTPIGPGQSCNIKVQLKAPPTPRIISAELSEWAKPSIDHVCFPFTIAVVSPQQFTITPTAGIGGTISPSTPQVVNSGGSLTFTATPASGYSINQWLLDGSVVQTGGTTYTLSNITANHKVAVSFALGFLTVGFSFDNNDFFFPVVYKSNNGGNTWTISTGLTLQSNQIEGELFGVACGASTCSAVGFSVDGTIFNNLPLAYFSTDRGNSWHFSSPLNPRGQGFLFEVSCAGNVCTSVGYSAELDFSKQLPLGYISNNGGVNWTLSSFSPPNQAQAQLSGIKCISNHCIAVGLSFDSLGNNQSPIAYISNDSGLNWTLSSPIPPAGQRSQSRLFGIDCVGSNCTAVGTSYDIDPMTFLNINQLPLAYTSSDGGNTWTISSPIPPSGQFQASLIRVTCVGPNCTTVGFSSDVNGNNSLPLSYTSNDKGLNWILSTPLALPSGQTQGQLSGIACVNSGACASVGESFRDSFETNLPLAYTSGNLGINWLLSSAFPLPNGQIGGFLSSVTNAGV